MPIRKRMGGVKRRVPAGDLDRLITLQTRAITAPMAAADVDYDEIFSQFGESVWADIQTHDEGEVFFDQTNTDGLAVTHEIKIHWIEGIAPFYWIVDEYNVVYDILTVNDFDRRQEFMILKCNIRGLKDFRTNLS